MRTPFARALWFLQLLLAVGALAPAPATAQEPAGDPVAAYRSFLDTLDRAESLKDLYPYFPASTRDEMEKIPDETAPQVLQGFRTHAVPPPGEWEVVARKVAGDRAHLVVGVSRAEGDVQVRLEGTVELLEEDGGWKIGNVDGWYEVEVLPQNLSPDTEPTPLGPGAERRSVEEFDPVTYRPGALAAGSGATWGGTLAFDPRGRYLALGNTRGARIVLLRLDTLQEVWSAQAPHAYGTLSFRADGRALAIITENGWELEVVPLSPNLERKPPGREYFFSHPTLTEATAAVKGRADWSDAAYHPQQPILALAFGDSEDEERGAIAFQPTGEGLWIPGERAAPQVWRTEGKPGKMVWAPAGERLAWLSTAQEPGSPIYVRGYPSGEEDLVLSRPDFIPGRIAFDREGRHLAAVGGMGDGMAVVVWDVETGAELASLPGIARAVFAPDGRHLFVVRDIGVMVTPGVGDEILVWELGAPAPVHTISAFPPGEDGRPHYIVGLGVSPNGRFLVAVSDVGGVRLWEAGGRF